MVTAIAPFDQMDVQLNLFNLAMFNQALLGTVFGSQSPRVQVPNLLNLFEAGELKIDEIITQEYSLDQVQQGYEDQAAGTIIRGVVKFEELTAEAPRAQAPRTRVNPSGMTRSDGRRSWADVCPRPSIADSKPLRMRSSTFSTPAWPLAARPQR